MIAKKQITKLLKPDEAGSVVQENNKGKKDQGVNILNKAEITVLKFSPLGQVLAVGCKDSNIYILSTVNVSNRLVLAFTILN